MPVEHGAHRKREPQTRFSVSLPLCLARKSPDGDFPPRLSPKAGGNRPGFWGNGPRPCALPPLPEAQHGPRAFSPPMAGLQPNALRLVVTHYNYFLRRIVFVWQGGPCTPRADALQNTHWRRVFPGLCPCLRRRLPSMATPFPCTLGKGGTRFPMFPLFWGFAPILRIPNQGKLFSPIPLCAHSAFL